MANTVIALKKSATPSASPGNLANGEIAINYADGVLYYKNAAGYIAQITGGAGGGNAFGTVNANNTLVVADTTGDIVSLVPGNNISIIGDAVNDKITVALKDDVTITGTFLVDNGVGAGGSVEGGEIRLANATASSVLTGPVAIDIYGNKLRIFETQGTNRGAYIDLSAASTGVGSDLLSPGSTTDGVARAAASAAYDKANSGNIIASSAYDKANAANVLAHNALPNTDGVTFSGTLTVSKNLVSDKIIASNNSYGENFRIGDDAWLGDVNIADTFRIKGAQDPTRAYVIFNTSDTKALGRAGSGALTWDGNTLWHAGNDGAGSTLDSDLLDGQHGSYYGIATDVTAAFAKGNAAHLTANTAYDKANSANILAYNTGTGANAFASATIAGANTAVGTGANAYAAAIANTIAIAAFEYANTISSDADEKANAAIITANAAYDKANSANINASFANTVAIAAYNYANGITFTQDNTIANLAYDKANASNILAYQIGDALDKVNTTVTYANSAWDKANAANYYAYLVDANAKAAFDFANTITFTQDNTIANLAYDKANSANVLAYNTGIGSNAYADATFVKLSATEQTIDSDITITGNLIVSGNTIAYSANNLVVNDPLIILANNNISDALDIGFVGHYQNTNGYNVHTGFYREHENKMYYLFNDYDKEPGTINHIGAFSNNMTLAVLNADLITSNLTLAGVNAVITLRSSYDKGNAAHDTANASYDKANAANILAYQSDANAIFANTVAIAAFDFANTITFTQDNTIANLAYDKANAANLLALAAFNKANANNGIGNSLDKQVLFNDGGISNGSVGLTYDKSTETLNVSNINVTGTLAYISANSVTVGDSQVNSIVITTSTISDQIIDSFLTTDWRSAHYHATMNSGSSYQTTQISLLHDGTNSYMTEYGFISNNEILGVFSSTVNSGSVRFNIAPTNAVTTIRLFRTTVK